MVLLSHHNLFLESIPTHRSECVLSHIQSGCFFDSDLNELFKGNETSIDRKIKQHLSVPCLFPSVRSVIPSYAPSTALSVCRDFTSGVYHDLETGKCISRISRDIYTKVSTDSLPELSGACTYVAAAEDSGNPLVFLGNAAGDINVVDLRVGVKGEFGHPVMSLTECHTGAVSSMYNFRSFSFSLATSGFEDGRVNFYDLRFPYDHLKNSYAERAMPLRTFEMHTGNQTKYSEMDESDQQILKHMKIGRINSMTASHDERLLAMSNGQSEVAICSTTEDVRVLKMGFLSSKDDYATSMAFSEHDTHLFCATYDLLAAIARCKSYINELDNEFPGTEPFNMVSWPLLNFQSNDWVTTPISKFSYHKEFDLVDDMAPWSVLGESLSEDSDRRTLKEAHPSAMDYSGLAPPSIYSHETLDEIPDEMDDNKYEEPKTPDLRLIAHRKAEACHRSYRLKRPEKINPLIFTVVGDYAVSTGGYETDNPTIDVWDPMKQTLLSSSSTPESRKVRFENICSGKDGTVLLSGSFERSSTLRNSKPDGNGLLLNKCICVMKRVTRESLASANSLGTLTCSFT